MKNIITLKSSKSKSLSGNFSPPGDKSVSIRALLISSLCLGNSKITNLLESDDVINTIKCLKNLGIRILKKNGVFEIFGNGGYFKTPKKDLNFGNSGTGVRLLIGLLSSREINATFTGDQSLRSRPMMRIIEPLLKMNSLIEHNNGFLPVRIKDNQGLSIPINYKLKIGSAQIKSAILLASLNVKGTTKIKELHPSRDHTEIMLKNFGVKIKKNKNEISITSPNFLKPKNIIIPGDFSSTAFLIVATLITKNSRMTFNSVGLNFFRTGLLEILKRMKAKIKIFNKQYYNGEIVGDIVVESSDLLATNVEPEIAPRLIDEYPILFVAASFASGSSKFRGLGELKFKESNRLKAMTEALKFAGVDVEAKEDSLIINGSRIQVGGNIVRTFHDHRIAMSMLVFGLASEESITIDDPKMIKTSFPSFYETLSKAGGNISNVKN